MEGALAGFDWDESNRQKCQKHGVSAGEIEALFLRSLMILQDEGHSLTETRFKAIGKTRANRHVFLVFTIRERQGKQYIRPISARYMHSKEVEHYERENPGL